MALVIPFDSGEARACTSMYAAAPGRFEITPEQKADKEFIQKKKGIKLLEVSLLSHLGKGRTPESVYTPLYHQAEEGGTSGSENTIEVGESAEMTYMICRAVLHPRHHQKYMLHIRSSIIIECRG